MIHQMAKILDLKSAVGMIRDGDVILANGFYGNGTPEEIIDEILRQGQKDLVLVNNDGGSPEKGIGRLIYAERAKKLICTWCGRIPLISELAEQGKTELELCPQGTFVERIRAGGYGLGGVLTRTGLDTIVEERWGERVSLNGGDWLYQTPIRGNVTIVEADRADTAGNLVFHLTQRTFAPAMCFASDLVIAVVRQPIVPAGEIAPDSIDVPGIVVNVLIQREGGDCA